MSVNEAARRFRLSKSELLRRMENGELAYLQEGSQRLLEAAEVRRVFPAPGANGADAPTVTPLPPLPSPTCSSPPPMRRTEAGELTVSAASRLYNVPRSTLYSKMERGELPFRLQGTRRLLDGAVLAQLFASAPGPAAAVSAPSAAPITPPPAAVDLTHLQRRLDALQDQHRLLKEEQDLLRRHLERATRAILTLQEDHDRAPLTRMDWLAGLFQDRPRAV